MPDTEDAVPQPYVGWYTAEDAAPQPETQHAAGCCGDPEPHRAPQPDTALTVERIAWALSEDYGDPLTLDTVTTWRATPRQLAGSILRALDTLNKENGS